MPKIERINDQINTLAPLKVTRRKALRTSPRRVVSPRVRVQCGCCKSALEIVHDAEPTGNLHWDSLEINGVNGTVDQWRQVFLPLLGMKTVNEDRISQIVKLVTMHFNSFGGGQSSNLNPLKKALKNAQPQFAGGVDIESVVRFILSQ